MCMLSYLSQGKEMKAEEKTKNEKHNLSFSFFFLRKVITNIVGFLRCIGWYDDY